MDGQSNEMLGAFDQWKMENKSSLKMITKADQKTKVDAEERGMNSFDLYTRIYNENIMLMYKGAVTFDLVTSIIETLDRKVSAIEVNKKVQKMFYSAAVECIHNLYHHMEDVKGKFKEISEHDARSGMITVLVKEKYYNILTGNFIPTRNTYNLKEKIDEVNSTDKEGLRTLYKETLSNGEFSEKGTAGLGLIQLARKTGEKLNYRFDKVNGEYSYFTFQIKINRD